jgi:3D-(3,5/4)-trihydroxycyclohexane-1,2-dione acylhydrolase (decyclizing)
MAGGRLAELEHELEAIQAGGVEVTAAQALVRFLAAQYVERDGVRAVLGGCVGIFGHGNVAGSARRCTDPRSPDLLPGDERAGWCTPRSARWHRLIGFKQFDADGNVTGEKRFLGLFSSAAYAESVNRIPVLLLPGDVFASRRPDPVLQQLEAPWAGDVSVNDCFRPVSRYFDRIWRPEQVVSAAMQAMRVLVNQAETGAVTLAFPQDVQVEAFGRPKASSKRVGRSRAAADRLRSCVQSTIRAGSAADRGRRRRHLSEATEACCA